MLRGTWDYCGILSRVGLPTTHHFLIPPPLSPRRRKLFDRLHIWLLNCKVAPTTVLREEFLYHTKSIHYCIIHAWNGLWSDGFVCQRNKLAAGEPRRRSSTNFTAAVFRTTGYWYDLLVIKLQFPFLLLKKVSRWILNYPQVKIVGREAGYRGREGALWERTGREVGTLVSWGPWPWSWDSRAAVECGTRLRLCLRLCTRCIWLGTRSPDPRTRPLSVRTVQWRPPSAPATVTPRSYHFCFYRLSTRHYHNSLFF